MIKNTIALLILIFLSMASGASDCPNLTNSRASTMIANSRVITDHPLVSRAQNIFKRVRAIAMTHGGIEPPLLYVIELDNIFIQSVPDGVMMSQKMLNIVYDSGYETSQNDAILAFILGHELAHIVNKHPENQTSHCWALSESISKDHNWSWSFWNTEKECSEIDSTRQADERMADKYGLLYAAAAGFDINRHFDEAFFEKFWPNTQTCVYPSWKERLADIQKVITQVRQKLAYWQVATYLQHFNYPETAIYFYKEHRYKTGLYTPETLNNLGLSYLEMAIKILNQRGSSCEYHSYRLPSILSLQSALAESVDPRGEKECITPKTAFDKFSGNLKDAEYYLKKAIEMNEAYLAARINLATVYFLKGHFYSALGELEQPVNDPSMSAIMTNLKALALYHQLADIPFRPGFDIWSEVTQQLNEVLKMTGLNNDIKMALHHNLALLLDKRGHNAAAAKHRSQQYKKEAPKTGPWTPPLGCYIEPELITSDCKSGLRILKNLDSLEYDFGGKRNYGQIFYNKDMLFLAMADDNGNRLIELAVSKKPDLRQAEQLMARYGPPTRQQTVSVGVIWNYGNRWAVLVDRDQSIREIWVKQ
jgi:tetratricopeptide (TPR) repeat protein